MSTGNSDGISPELDALLGVVAGYVASGTYERVDLFNKPLFRNTDAVVASLNRHVSALSSGKYSVKAADFKLFADLPMGRCIFCARVDNQTKEEKLFVVFAASQGFWYSDRKSS